MSDELSVIWEPGIERVIHCEPGHMPIAAALLISLGSVSARLRITWIGTAYGQVEVRHGLTPADKRYSSIVRRCEIAAEVSRLVCEDCGSGGAELGELSGYELRTLCAAHFLARGAV